MMYLYNT